MFTREIKSGLTSPEYLVLGDSVLPKAYALHGIAGRCNCSLGKFYCDLTANVLAKPLPTSLQEKFTTPIVLDPFRNFMAQLKEKEEDRINFLNRQIAPLIREIAYFTKINGKKFTARELEIMKDVATLYRLYRDNDLVLGNISPIFYKI